MKDDQALVINYRTVPRWLVPLCLTASVSFGALWVGFETDSNMSRYWAGQSQLLAPVRHLIDSTFRGHFTDSNLHYPFSIGPAHVLPPPEEFGIRPGFARRILHDTSPGLGPDQILFGLMALTVLGVLIAHIGKENKLILRKDGISFPIALSPGLIGRIHRKWSDICAIRFVELKPNNKATQASGLRDIRIYFRSGGSVILKLSQLSQQDLEQFLLALERWGEKCAMPPDMIALRHKILQQQQLQSPLSHTAMWEEELRFNFAATNFIPLAAGKTLQSGRYKVVMQLGAGGLSAVYLAECGDNVVIVKEAVVPPSTDSKVREKARELFKREAQLLLKLKHPKIAQVLDHFVEDGRDYLVLQYIPGRSLREVVKRDGAQSEDKVLLWAKQIAEILQYLHNLNPQMVHRDLTPDNLVLTPEGDIRLIDFGAANELVGTATGTLIGKQLYIAPEQFRGKAQPESDLYSLGATLFFALTGAEPEALSVSTPKSICPDLSDKANMLVELCTQTEPQNRMRSAEEVIQFLQSDDVIVASQSTIHLNKTKLESAT